MKDGIRITVGPEQSPEPELIRLTSTDMIHSPGMVHWAMHLDHETFDAGQTATFVKLGFLAQLFPGLKGKYIRKILDGEFKVEGDCVIIEKDLDE